MSKERRAEVTTKARPRYYDFKRKHHQEYLKRRRPLAAMYRDQFDYEQYYRELRKLWRLPEFRAIVRTRRDIKIGTVACLLTIGISALTAQIRADSAAQVRKDQAITQLTTELDQEVQQDKFNAFNNLSDGYDNPGNALGDIVGRTGQYEYSGDLQVGICRFPGTTAQIEVRSGTIIDIGSYVISLPGGPTVEIQNLHELDQALPAVHCE